MACTSIRGLTFRLLRDGMMSKRLSAAGNYLASLDLCIIVGLGIGCFSIASCHCLLSVITKSSELVLACITFLR